MAPDKTASNPERTQDVAAALTGAVDSALRSVVSSLKTEVCRRTESSADEKEANGACYRLLQQLLERSQARAQQFENFISNYLLKAPEGPCAALDERFEDKALARPQVEELTGHTVPPLTKQNSSHIDEEIARAEAQLLQSFQRAAALKKEASVLSGQLSLLEAAEDATGHPGLKSVAAELASVARKVNKLTGKENRDYCCDFNQKASHTKRRGFLEDWEEDDGPWPETPKRQRFGLLG